MTQNRTHTCGELRLSDAGKAVKICGWLENLREVGSELAFAVVRDFYGTTQVVAETAQQVAQLKSINKESTISVEGTVRERDSKNAKLPTGEIEVVPGKIEVLGRCQHNELPFPINRSREADEATRLKYRYLDLRNPAVKNNIILRCQVVAALRQAMTEHGFLEITTPILTASSPEGARDYLVPARNHPGKFYALPQAPQQSKQTGTSRSPPASGTRTPGRTAPPVSFTSWTWRWLLPLRMTYLPYWRTCCPPSLPSTANTTGPAPRPSCVSLTPRPWRSMAPTSRTCAST